MIEGAYKPKETDKPLVRYFFDLVSEPNTDYTTLIVVDENGKKYSEGNIARIHNVTGKISTIGAVSERFGFMLDRDGSVGVS